MANPDPTSADKPSLAVAAALGACVGLAIGSAYIAGALSRAAVDDAQAKLVAGTTAVTPPGYVTWRARFAEVAAAPVADALSRIGLRGPAQPARDLECLSQAVYYEARGEQERGRQAVAQVVLNRVRHPHFPKSVCGVVFQHADDSCAFSFTCDGQTRHPLELAAWRDAHRIAQLALAGFVLPEIGSATDFRSGHWGAPSGRSRVAEIGGHIFYRVTGRAPHTAPSRADVGDAPPVAPPVVIRADAPVKANASAATPAA